ncbi:hypothetical protein G9F71_004380 [Clostridium sp. FP2]|nr:MULTISPECIES: hypothetical protein [Clostridium]MBU3128016.1 hypothetical protein [Clostridium tagluense]MBZ9622096.1 hypothetical protein [Clostridium sp. FP2]
MEAVLCKSAGSFLARDSKVFNSLVMSLPYISIVVVAVVKNCYELTGFLVI